MAEILLDPAIRFWVFLPIVLINFFFGIVRNYIMSLMTNEKKPDLQNVADTQVLLRSRLLRENGKFLPKTAFSMRKHYFNDKETGFFRTQKREKQAANPFDQGLMTDMMKGQMMNVLPMMMIGTWINYAFSGFLTTKVPFPLTFRFKPMLQRGMESLVSLDASWVSSASWYFLNFFGLRSMYSLLLGADNNADQARAMQDAFVGMGQQQQGQMESEKLFKSEWETLELTQHTFALANADEELAAMHLKQRAVGVDAVNCAKVDAGATAKAGVSANGNKLDGAVNSGKMDANSNFRKVPEPLDGAANGAAQNHGAAPPAPSTQHRKKK